MAEDSGAILRHISSLKDMLDKVNEEIEQNIQRTREIESEIVKHSETEKHYLDKECELTKEASVAEFELNGLIQVAVLESELRYRISEYTDVLNDINNMKILFTSSNSEDRTM